MPRRGLTLVEILMIVAIVLILAYFAVAGFMVDETGARRALENGGYTDIVLLERHNCFAGLRGCDKRDDAVFFYRACMPGQVNCEQKVEVIVCAGWPFKAATIRTK